MHYTWLTQESLQVNVRDPRTAMFTRPTYWGRFQRTWTISLEFLVRTPISPHRMSKAVYCLPTCTCWFSSTYVVHVVPALCIRWARVLFPHRYGKEDCQRSRQTMTPPIYQLPELQGRERLGLVVHSGKSAFARPLTPTTPMYNAYAISTNPSSAAPQLIL